MSIFKTAFVIFGANIASFTAAFALHDGFATMNEFMFEKAMDIQVSEKILTDHIPFTQSYETPLSGWRLSAKNFSKKGFYDAFDSMERNELSKAWSGSVAEIAPRLKTCDATFERLQKYESKKYDPAKAKLENEGRFVTPERETILDAFACYMKERKHYEGSELTTISESYRITNISAALKLLDGKVIMPGETVSAYSELFSGKADYVPGFGIKTVKGKTEAFKVDGGGVCGVSTVLYQSALKVSGLSVVERHPHSVFYTYYYGKTVGLDATIFGNGKTPQKDLKLRNDSGVPLVITTYVKPVKNGKFVYGLNVFGFGIGKNSISSTESKKCGSQTITNHEGKKRTVKSCYSGIER